MSRELPELRKIVACTAVCESCIGILHNVNQAGLLATVGLPSADKLAEVEAKALKKWNESSVRLDQIGLASVTQSSELLDGLRNKVKLHFANLVKVSTAVAGTIDTLRITAEHSPGGFSWRLQMPLVLAFLEAYAALTKLCWVFASALPSLKVVIFLQRAVAATGSEDMQRLTSFVSKFSSGVADATKSSKRTAGPPACPHPWIAATLTAPLLRCVAGTVAALTSFVAATDLAVVCSADVLNINNASVHGDLRCPSVISAVYRLALRPRLLTAAATCVVGVPLSYWRECPVPASAPPHVCLLEQPGTASAAACKVTPSSTVELLRDLMQAAGCVAPILYPASGGAAAASQSMSTSMPPFFDLQSALDSVVALTGSKTLKLCVRHGCASALWERRHQWRVVITTAASRVIDVFAHDAAAVAPNATLAFCIAALAAAAARDAILHELRHRAVLAQSTPNDFPVHMPTAMRAHLVGDCLAVTSTLCSLLVSPPAAVAPSVREIFACAHSTIAGMLTPDLRTFPAAIEWWCRTGIYNPEGVPTPVTEWLSIGAILEPLAAYPETVPLQDKSLRRPPTKAYSGSVDEMFTAFLRLIIGKEGDELLGRWVLAALAPPPRLLAQATAGGIAAQLAVPASMASEKVTSICDEFTSPPPKLRVLSSSSNVFFLSPIQVAGAVLCDRALAPLLPSGPEVLDTARSNLFVSALEKNCSAVVEDAVICYIVGASTPADRLLPFCVSNVAAASLSLLQRLCCITPHPLPFRVENVANRLLQIALPGGPVAIWEVIKSAEAAVAVLRLCRVPGRELLARFASIVSAQLSDFLAAEVLAGFDSTSSGSAAGSLRQTNVPPPRGTTVPAGACLLTLARPPSSTAIITSLSQIAVFQSLSSGNTKTPTELLAAVISPSLLATVYSDLDAFANTVQALSVSAKVISEQSVAAALSPISAKKNSGLTASLDACLLLGSRVATILSRISAFVSDVFRHLFMNIDTSSASSTTPEKTTNTLVDGFAITGVCLVELLVHHPNLKAHLERSLKPLPPSIFALMLCRSVFTHRVCTDMQLPLQGAIPSIGRLRVLLALIEVLDGSAEVTSVAQCLNHATNIAAFSADPAVLGCLIALQHSVRVSRFFGLIAHTRPSKLYFSVEALSRLLRQVLPV